jgi:hypothetical protein
MATNLLRCGKWYKTTKLQMAATASGAGETPKAKHASNQAKAQEHEQDKKKAQEITNYTTSAHQPNIRLCARSPRLYGCKTHLHQRCIHESANRRL